MIKPVFSVKASVCSSAFPDPIAAGEVASRIKFGIVGTGLVAQNYLQAFKESKHAQLSAVADISEERLVQVSQSANCLGYTDYRELAKDGAVQAVIVCAPPSIHEEIASYFLERGVHVLCEKPLTVSVEQLERLERSSRKSAAILSMASKFRHVLDIQKSRELIEQGTIGEPALFENAFISDVDMSSRWNVNRAVSGGGVWIDNGTHSVDIMRFLLGSVAAVRVEEGRNVRGLPVEETVHACLRTEDGVVGSINLSWSGSSNSEFFVRIFGSRGVLEIGWKQSRWRLFSESEWHVFGSGYNKVASFVAQIDDFSNAVLGRVAPRVTWDDMRASVEVITAGYRSLSSTKWELVGATLPRIWTEKILERGPLEKVYPSYSGFYSRRGYVSAVAIESGAEESGRNA